MRNPYFFPPGKGKQHAPLLTEVIRDIKAALHAQAKRLKRREYLLTANVPLTPELALSCGLDVAAWDAEELFDAANEPRKLSLVGSMGHAFNASAIPAILAAVNWALETVPAPRLA